MEKFDWIGTQISALNFKGLGQAKKQLDRARLIRTTKWIYGWFKVGAQKQKMGEDGTCPCCGLVEEDQLHLFRCNNQQMEATFDSSIRKLQKSLYKDGISTPVVIAFIKELCRCAKKPPLLERQFTVKTYSPQLKHHRHWALKHSSEAFITPTGRIYYQILGSPPATLPNGKKERRKDPMEQSSSLIHGVWDIMEAVWECRNAILRGKESQLISKSEESVTARLLEFRLGNLEMLRRCDRFIVTKHSIQDVIRWPREQKKAVLNQLETLHKVYLGELHYERKGYRDIRSYFTRLDDASRTENESNLGLMLHMPVAKPHSLVTTTALEIITLLPSTTAPTAPSC
jgi:hypothetical protein